MRIRYTNIAADWCNIIRLREDIQATGQTTVIHLEGGFFNERAQQKDFSPTGDYLHFLLAGQDITISPAAVATATPDQRARGIAILGQRFVAQDELEVTLAIGSQVSAGLYDVDVKLGVVKAYTDELSLLTAGANGAHRMKEALAVVHMKIEKPNGDDTGAIAAVSDPHPVIELDRPTMSLSSNGLLAVRVSGYVHDALADITPTGAADLSEITVGGVTVPVTKVADNRPVDERFRPFPWRGRFETTLSYPLRTSFEVEAKATNKLGNIGYDRATVTLVLSYVDEPVPEPEDEQAATVIPGCVLDDGLRVGDIDRLSLIESQSVGLPAFESDLDSRVWPATVAGRPVTISIMDAPAVLDSTIQDTFTLRIVGGGLRVPGVIPLIETGPDSRIFFPDPKKAAEIVACVFKAIPAERVDPQVIVTTTIDSITVTEHPGTTEGTVKPLVVSFQQPRINGAFLLPGNAATIDGHLMSVVDEPVGDVKRMKLPLLLVKKPVPPELSANGNIITARPGAGAVAWTPDIGRLIGMAYVQGDPSDLVRYGKGLQWPITVQFMNISVEPDAAGSGAADTSRWYVRVTPTAQHADMLDQQIPVIDKRASQRPWYGWWRKDVFSMTVTGRLNAETAEMGERDVELQLDSQVVGTAEQQIEIVKTKAILFCVDGLGAHWLKEAAKIPGSALSQIVGENPSDGVYQQAVYATAQSALPSITWANWASVLTGLPPKGHGVYGNSFFRRDMPAERPIFSGNDASGIISDLTGSGEGGVHLRAIREGLNFLLRDGVQTVFEQVEQQNSATTTASILTWYGRGADTMPTYTSALGRRVIVRIVKGAGASIIFGAWNPVVVADAASDILTTVNEVHGLSGHETDGSTAILADQFGREELLRTWTGDEPPDFTAVYLPGPDNYGHAAGEDGGSSSHDTITGNEMPFKHFIRHTDGEIRKVVDRVRELGMDNAVIYLLVSDHGQTVTDHPKKVEGVALTAADIAKDIHGRIAVEGEYQDQMKAILEKVVGLRDRDFYLSKQDNNHVNSSVVFSPNGGMAYVYVRNPTAPAIADSWRTPDPATIATVASAVWRTAHSPELAASIGYPSFAGALGPNPVVLVRQTGAMRNMNGEFYNETNVMMAIRQVLVRDDGQTRYDLASLEDIIYEHGDWLNFPLRMRELDDRHGMNPMNARMGDIIIIADTRNGYNAVHEGDAYPGWHGGPSQADSEVPLLLGSTALRLESHNVWLRSLLAESRNPFSPSTYRNEDMSSIIVKLGERLW